jgi:hypothetical protein
VAKQGIANAKIVTADAATGSRVEWRDKNRGSGRRNGGRSRSRRAEKPVIRPRFGPRVTGERKPYSSDFSNRKAAGEFRTAATWLKSPRLTAGKAMAFRGHFPTKPYGKYKKSRIRREKSESEILVNGSKVARINQESGPEVVGARFATALDFAALAYFSKENQCDRRV